MNAKQRRQAKRHPVERGFGPRHAFNAQEGAEEVPQPDDFGPGWQLQRALHSARQKVPGAAKWFLNEVRSGILSDEDIAEIRRNPVSPQSLMALGNAAIMLNPEFAGRSPGKLPGVPKMPKPGLKVPDYAPRYEGPADAVPESPYPWKLPEKGFPGTPPKGQTWEQLPDWLKQQYPNKEMLTEKDWADIQSYQQAEKDYNPDAHGSDLEKAYGKEDALDKQFPSLNKPPYDALKEQGGPSLANPEGAYPSHIGDAMDKFNQGHDLTSQEAQMLKEYELQSQSPHPEVLKAMNDVLGGKKWGASPPPEGFELKGGKPKSEWTPEDYAAYESLPPEWQKKVDDALKDKLGKLEGYKGTEAEKDQQALDELSALQEKYNKPLTEADMDMTEPLLGEIELGNKGIFKGDPQFKDHLQAMQEYQGYVQDPNVLKPMSYEQFAKENFGVDTGAAGDSTAHMSPKEVQDKRQHFDDMHQAYIDAKPINAEAADLYEMEFGDKGTVLKYSELLTSDGWTKVGDHYVPPDYTGFGTPAKESGPEDFQGLQDTLKPGWEVTPPKKPDPGGDAFDEHMDELLNGPKEKKYIDNPYYKDWSGKDLKNIDFDKPWEPNPDQMGAAWHPSKDPALMSPAEKQYWADVAAGKDPGKDIVPHHDEGPPGASGEDIKNKILDSLDKPIEPHEYENPLDDPFWHEPVDEKFKQELSDQIKKLGGEPQSEVDKHEAELWNNPDEGEPPLFPWEQKMFDQVQGTGKPPEGPFHKGDKSWQTWEEYLKDNPPEDEELPPFEPGAPRFRKGTKGVRHNPKTKTGRPRKIGVEKGFGPRHAENAKEGEDLTQYSTDTVPAMLTPREAVLNRNAAELAGRDQIEALNEQGNELARKGVDLAGRKPMKLQEGNVDLPPINIDPNLYPTLPNPTVQINPPIQENPFYASQHTPPMDIPLVPPPGVPNVQGPMWDPGSNLPPWLRTILGSNPYFQGFRGAALGGQGLWRAGGSVGNLLKKLFGDHYGTGQGSPVLGGAGGGGGAGRGDRFHDIFGPRSSASGIPGVGVGIGPTGAPAVGREWWSPDFGRWDLGASGMGAGGYNLAGPGGGFGQHGTGFGSGTVGNFLTAIGFGGKGFGGGGGTSNIGLLMSKGGEGTADRPHFNPYFTGGAQDKMAGGPSVKLRAKGDKDVKAKEKPKKYEGGTGKVPSPGQLPAYWPGGQPPTGPFPGRGEGGVYPQPPEQIGGMQGPQPGLAWQHKRNMAPQGPGLDWQRKRAAAVAAGQDQPLMPPGRGVLGEPPGYGYAGPAPVPPPNAYGAPKGSKISNNFYPPGQGIQYGATGISDIGSSGESIYGNAVPVQLSAPGGLGELVKAITAEAQKQGLSPSQISSILGAFKGLGGGGGSYAGAGGYLESGLEGRPGYAQQGTANVPGYAGGISDLGYAPFAAPSADFDPYRGGWIGRYDPALMTPAY